MTVLENGNVVTESQVLFNHDVVIEESRIVAIQPSAGPQSDNDARQSSGLTTINATDAWVMPGFIDVHADYVEHMAAPRPTSIMDFTLALRESERELISHGITTMFHSLALYDFTEFAPSPMRSPEHTRTLIGAIGEMHESLHLIRHRFHARFEIDNLRRVDELEEYIRDRRVHLVSFMDHTPGQGQYRDLELYRKTLKAYRNISDDELVRVIEKSRSREKLTAQTIARIAALAHEHGIAVASHDDDSVEKLEFVSEIGATISEFPITLEVAQAAREHGLHTVAGAPNVLLGGSHSGNLSAEEAIVAGAVDILCSDYYPPALLHALFQLHHRRGFDLAQMVRLVTLNPAKAVFLDDELGSLSPGKRADVLVVRQVNGGFPAVTDALVDGALVFQTRYRV